MPPHLALIGGEEFTAGFEGVHASLLKDTGIAQPRLIFLPTCAADDGDEAIEYWCNTAREKFTALGAFVETPRIVDVASANDPHYAQLITDADLIYFGGGYPHVTMRILPHTRVLAALVDALQRDVIIAGSSGGAPLTEFIDCLGWVAHGFCAPHFNRLFPWKWLERGILADADVMIGLDEQTALISRADGRWEVRGHGGVTLIRNAVKPVQYHAGERLSW